jgi:hypothetical protein
LSVMGGCVFKRAKREHEGRWLFWEPVVLLPLLARLAILSQI